jgi:hypothetical protein
VVTTAKPLPPPPPPGPSDEELVRRTIMAYAQAFAAVNAAGVVQVFPSMQGTIGELFRNVEWQRIDISNPQVAVNGNRATVRAMVEQTVKPRAGGELRVRESTDFQLEKRGSSWIILQRARAR